ncbi:MAG: DUF5069 domain-containing protein [Verrucomicrobiales bacterium]
MNHYHWPLEFKKVYEAAIDRYRAGTRDPGRLFLPIEQQFLDSIGATTQEIFDFVDDYCRYGEPAFETVLLITSARRDYFLTVQKGKRTGKMIDMDSLPSKREAVNGIEWLPRIIVKARAKLRGEMPLELMYGCGGDRPFLESMNIEPADFLRMVWAAEDDDQKIIKYVEENRAAAQD